MTMRGICGSGAALLAMVLSTGLFSAGSVAEGAASAAPAAPVAKLDAAAPGDNLPAGVAYIRSVEGVHEYSLPNGLQVLLLPDATAPKITVNVVYKVGSRHEVYGETGMAHLLEHLLFKGTPGHTNIPLELKQHGAQFNGTTDYDRTNYYETFLASDDNLAWALELEADRMVNSFVARKDLDTEMSVVRNEFEIGESRPANVLSQTLSAAMFHWHNYGRAVIGARSDIENVNIAHLQAFYHAHYRPDNAALIVGGKIGARGTLALIAKHFGPIPNPATAIEPLYTVEPTQSGERAVTVRRTGETPMVAIGHRIMSAQHGDVAAFRVLADLIGKAPNGRLHKRLVETGKATAAQAYWFAGYDPGRSTFNAVLRQGDNPDDVRDQMIKIIEGLGAEPASPEEVERAKAAFAAEAMKLRTNTQALTLALTSGVADGDWRLLFWDRDEAAKVSVADVQRVADKYLRRDNRTVGIFLPTEAPQRAEIPPRVDAAVLLKDYVGGAAMSQGEDFDPSPANIDARTTIVKLPGGLALALLPKQTRGDRVEGVLTLHIGDAESLKSWGDAPALLGALLSKGTQRLTRGALSDELTRLQAQLSISARANQIAANFSTTRDNLEPLLRLLAECLRTPALKLEEFQQIKRSRQRDFESAQKNPQSLASVRLGVLFNAYPKDHPYYAGTLAEQSERLERVTLDDVKRFHAEFYGASHGELSLVGSFDSPSVQRVADETLGHWASPKPYARIPQAKADAAPASETIEVADQANAVYAARQNIVMRDASPDYPALLIANTMFGGGALSSRLGTRLRQQEGLSYGSGSNVAVTKRDETGTFSIFASYAPQGAAKLDAAVCEEVHRALADGFTGDELATAKDAILSSSRVSRSADQTLAVALNHNLHDERTFAWSADLEAKISAATLDEVNAAFRRHIDPARLVIIKAGSFAGAGGSVGAPTVCKK